MGVDKDGWFAVKPLKGRLLKKKTIDWFLSFVLASWCQKCEPHDKEDCLTVIEPDLLLADSWIKHLQFIYVVNLLENNKYWNTKQLDMCIQRMLI